VLSTNGLEVTTQGGVEDQAAEPNPIATLVQGMMHHGIPGAVTTKDASGSPIVMANHNRIESDGPEDDSEKEAGHEEEGLKKGAAVNLKRNQEERAKIKSEERGKQDDIGTKKVVFEAKVKRDDQQVRVMSEESVKKGKLSMREQIGIAQKQVDHANKEVQSIGDKVAQDQEVEIERVKYAERTAQRKIDFVRKKASEEVYKLNQKTEMKVKTTRRQNKLKMDMYNAQMKVKTRAQEEKGKLKAEQEETIKRNRKADEEDRKDKQEGESKSAERREKTRLRREKLKEQAQKRRHERKRKFQQRQQKRREEAARKKIKERVGKFRRIGGTSWKPRNGAKITSSADIPNTGMYTYTFWIMPTGKIGNWGSIMHKGANNGQRNPAIWFYPGQTRLHCRSGVSGSWNMGADPPDQLRIGSWTFVALTHKAGYLAVYLNGRLRAAVRTGGPLMNNGPMWGGDPWHGQPRCKVADMRMYGRILQSTELKMIQREAKHP